MPGIQCQVPIRIRLVGQPGDEDLAGLEAAVTRLVTSRMLLAAEQLGRRHGWPRGGRAPDRAYYEPWRDQAGEGGYQLPSYQQPREPVRVPLQKELQPIATLADAAEKFVSKYSGYYGLVFDVNGAAEGLVRHLQQSQFAYTFVRAVFDALPSKVEDNVAAEFLDRMPDWRLHVFTLTAEGRAMLDVLYQAMITGDVSAFERRQAERILQAKKYRTTQEQFLESLQHLKIFPIRNIGVTREASATFRAVLLPSGKVRVHYTSERLYQFDMFKSDRETLPGYSRTMNGFDLDPEEIVAVRLYDQGGELVPIPALALIDFSNQIQESTLGTAATAFFTGLTIGAGGLGAAAMRGLQAGTATRASLWASRALMWADRIAFALPAGSMVINEHRDWIRREWPDAGPALLEAVDTANRLAAYYGWAQLSVASLRYLSSGMRSALDGWRAARARGGPSAESWYGNIAQERINAVDAEAESLINEFTYAEEQAPDSATRTAHPQQPGPVGEGAGAEIDIEQATRPEVKGGKRPTIGGKAVATKRARRLDIGDFTLLPGETTQRQALARIRRLIGKKINETPLGPVWEQARRDVVGSRSLANATRQEMVDLYDKVRDRFWDLAKRDTAAARFLEETGFQFESGRAPLLRVDKPDIPIQERRVSLDHNLEKALGENYRKAIDADNLTFEFHNPNSNRETVQVKFGLRPGAGEQ